MDAIAVMKNPIQAYAWGSKTAIPSLLGLPVPSEKAVAELWLGAHPRAPSQVRVNGGWQPLDRAIHKDPVSALGRQAAERFSNGLPFLLKVLAAESPLSIQVHPNLEQARAGFEREARMGIPLTANHRNYKDSNHKPEILCAMTEFEALKGFRSPEDIAGLLKKACNDAIADEAVLLTRDPEGPGLQRFFASLLSMDASRKGKILERATGRASFFAHEDRAFYWVVQLNQAYPGDIGVLSPLIFNLVILSPGEAIFIPPGEPHAYLRGMGVELMANSDNVVRGGLTQKHVDVPELLRIMTFRPTQVQKIRPRQVRQEAEGIYETPAAEFQLSVIAVSDGVSFLSEKDRSIDILLCTEGTACVQDVNKGAFETAERGVSLLVPAAVGRYRIDGKAILYRATVGRVQLGSLSHLTNTAVDGPA